MYLLFALCYFYISHRALLIIYTSILTQQYFQPQSNHSDTKDAVDPMADSKKAAADGGLAEKQRDEAKPE